MIPILIAIIAGYVAAVICGIVDFSSVSTASWLAIPNFSAPKFKWEAIVIVLPVLLVIASEHIGHQIVTSKIIGRDLLKEPGLHRSLFADNFSTMISGFIGSVPTTTYGENIGVMAMTKVYSVYVIGGAAVLSIICSFIGKLTMLINSIPGPVIGGISFLLYGMIGNFRYPYSGRRAGGLRPFQKYGNDIRDLCDRIVRNFRRIWRDPAFRNGTCLCDRNADGTSVLCTGSIKTDK